MQIRLQHPNALHCFCNRDSGLTGRCIRLAKFLQGNVALQRRRYHTFVVAENPSVETRHPPVFAGTPRPAAQRNSSLPKAAALVNFARDKLAKQSRTFAEDSGSEAEYVISMRSVLRIGSTVSRLLSLRTARASLVSGSSPRNFSNHD